MSEIKSPFLNDEDKMDKNKLQGTQNSNSLSGNADSNVGIEKGVLPNNSSAIQSTLSSADEEDASLEIQEEGKTLRNIIIVMIILLVLALMGLFAYNALNKKNNTPNGENVKQENNLEITDFDMKGEEFQAKSIIIEE